MDQLRDYPSQHVDGHGQNIPSLVYFFNFYVFLLSSKTVYKESSLANLPEKKLIKLNKTKKLENPFQSTHKECRIYTVSENR